MVSDARAFSGDSLRIIAPRALLLLISGVVALLIASAQTEADELSYLWRAGREFAYTFDITATVGDETERLSGASIYRPAPAGSEELSGEEAQGTGTAFVVKANGYLVTCAHVVQGATSIQVRLGGRSYDGKVVAMDKPHDLAVVKIDAKGLPTLPLADSSAVQLAEEVRAVGFPLSDVLGTSIKVTRGSIAGIVENKSGQVLQVDASINPGNSGGPVVNAKGEVVGIASAKLTGREVTNVGFAVPSNQAGTLLKSKRISYGTKGSMEGLDGPALAKKVTPAVALVVVNVGPGGIGSADRFALAFRGYLKEAAADAKSKGKVDPKETSTGRVLADTLGEVFAISDDVPSLPFGLGSQGQVGIERLPDGNERTWEVAEVVRIAHVFPTGPISHRPGETRKFETVVYPMARRAQYEMGERQSDGTVAIKKRYEVAALGGKGKTPFMELSTTGTVHFDPVQGMARKLKLTGTLTLNADRKTLSIPITFEYRQVDPRSLHGKLAGGSPTAGESSVPRVGYGGPPPIERAAVPAKDARQTAQTLVDRLFEKQLAAARTLAQHIAVAEKMLQYAHDEQNMTNRFVLLDSARRQAIETGDVAMAVEAADQLFQQYQIEAGRLEQMTVTALSKTAKTPSQYEQLAKLAQAIMNDAIEVDDFGTAGQFGRVALDAARNGKKSELAKEILDRGREMSKLKVAFQEVQSAKAVLAKSPNDPAANLKLGRYHCFVRGAWSRGLAMLALSDDADTRTVATMELESPDSAAKQAKIGDAWWKLADRSENQAYARLIKARSVMWYRKAVPNLSGLARLEVQQRLDEVGPDQVATAKPSGTDDERPTTPRKLSGVSARRVLIEQISAAVSQDNVSRSEEVGFKLGGTAYNVVPKAGGLLIGLDITYGPFNSVQSIRPIFHTAKGQILGPAVGPQSRKAVRVLSRKGYAIGSITVAGGLGIEGLGITFMEIGSDGLNSGNQYKSPWYGKRGKQQAFGGDGTPLVGLHGRFSNQKVTTLGVVFAEIGE